MGAMKVVSIVLLIIAALSVLAGALLLLMLPDTAYDTPSGFDDWMTNSDPGSRKTYTGTLAEETYQNLSGTPTKAFRFRGCTLGFFAGSDVGNIGDEVTLTLEVRDAGGLHYAYVVGTESNMLYYVPGIIVLIIGLLFGSIGLIVLIVGAVRKSKGKTIATGPKKQGPAQPPGRDEKRVFAPPPPPPD
jgi:hypothetical protein